MSATETKIKWDLTEKQALAFEILSDDTTTELLFGGGAGGGKSMFGCGWLIYLSLRYTEIRCFMGRESLEDFKKSTMLSFIDTCTLWGLKVERDYHHNQPDKYFHFHKTGSRVYYSELSFYPSDQNYDYLGSTEYTAAFIDEANQVTAKAKSVIRSRVRYKLEQNGLKPKLLLTCNPSKGYLYSEFYKPSKDNSLSADKKFIQALVTDNWYIDVSYITNLEGLDKESKERMLFGNWEYDSDPSAMV